MAQIKETQVTGTKSVPTKSTRTVDCFQRIADEETGEKKVVRFQDERAVNVNLQTTKDAVFHNGARIA